MFIRVKRKKTTYFLHCDPSETVLETKHKLHALSDVPVDQQRLILLSSHAVLDDNRSLADQKVRLVESQETEKLVQNVESVELSFNSMGLFVGSWSPAIFHWLFCIQYQ